MTYVERREKGRNAWNWKAYPGRAGIIAGVTIHSTRSGATSPTYDDGPGTENWGMNPNNGSAAQGYGVYWDALIYRDGTRVISTDWDREYATWTAGYGRGGGTWPLGLYYLQIEVSQSRADQPFSDASIDSLAQLVAAASAKYAFPIERIPFVTQLGARPRGITTHEGSANGEAYGKSDPGPLFPWDTFLSLAKQYAAGGGGEDDMVDEEARRQIRELNAAMVKREQIREVASNPDLPAVERAHAALVKEGLIQ